MSFSPLEVLFIVAGYLSGSVLFAIVVSRALALEDPRCVASKNPGASNVVRVGGWLPAAATLIGDAAKATIPLSVALYFGSSDGGVALVALAAFLGHLFPIYYRFSGGKGVATYCGVLIATQPLAALAWVGGWLLLLALFRRSAVSGITMCAVAPLLLWWQSAPQPLLAVAVLMSVLVVIRHHENIRALVNHGDQKLF